VVYKLGKKSEALSDEAWKGEESQKGREEKPLAIRKGKEGVKKTGVARKKRKKVG
jgi:hypothetical protein